MSKSSDISLNLQHMENDYYQFAKDWYSEIYESITNSRNQYRFAALILSLLLGLTLICLSCLFPLKKYYYRIIVVNQQTGEVQQLKEVEGSTYNSNWTVTRYFISQFIQNRNKYNNADISRTFNLTLSMMDKAIINSYRAEILDTNPKSPINILGKDFYKQINVIGIDPLNSNTAIVRYQTITKDVNNLVPPKIDEFQAVVKWNYRKDKVNQSDLEKNPLGFFITYYESSPLILSN